MRKILHGYRGIGVTSWRKFGAYPRISLIGLTVIVSCLAATLPILSQSQNSDQLGGSLLPADTGEPLTIVPLDMHDVDCVVAQWRPNPTKPVLTLICPPSTVFAPLRVLIRLSWMKPEEVPVKPEHILAPTGTPTKIRTNKTAAQVLLQLDEKGDHKYRNAWIGFNAVVDVALLSVRGRVK
jgi:hypothetical protein